MPGPKGFAAVERMALRAENKRGGQEKQRDQYDRSALDSLGLCHDIYLETLGARNYAATTVEHRRASLKLFMEWASERSLTQASQITRPILESFQRWLWRY